MKKTKQILLAAALTASLALGATPAFAAAGVTNPDTPVDAQNQAKTKISIETMQGQLIAEVPLNVTVVAKMTGGALDVPGADVYTIKNGSAFDIYVKQIDTTAAEGWSLVQTDPGQVSPTAAKGDLFMQVKGVTLPASGSSYAGTIADALKVPALTAPSTKGVLDLALSGASSQLKGASAGATVTDAVEITYTLSATAPTA